MIISDFHIDSITKRTKCMKSIYEYCFMLMLFYSQISCDIIELIEVYAVEKCVAGYWSVCILYLAYEDCQKYTCVSNCISEESMKF